MPPTPKNDSAVISQNISYYNEIANVYDHIMDADNSNELVRAAIREKLQRLLPAGRVLDFGGGTGLDLEWLTKAGYQVIFCEPSHAMRQKAVETSSYDQQVIFLDEAHTDFKQWKEQAPFEQKADALIANFGVLNYIPGLRLLFENLVEAVRPGAPVLLMVLKLSLRQRLRWHRRNAMRSLFLRTPFVMYIMHKEHRQTVFVHTEKEIRKAAAGLFEFHGSDAVTGFTLIHLTRK